MCGADAFFRGVSLFLPARVIEPCGPCPPVLQWGLRHAPSPDEVDVVWYPSKCRKPPSVNGRVCPDSRAGITHFDLSEDYLHPKRPSAFPGEFSGDLPLVNYYILDSA